MPSGSTYVYVGRCSDTGGGSGYAFYMLYIVQGLACTSMSKIKHELWSSIVWPASACLTVSGSLNPPYLAVHRRHCEAVVAFKCKPAAVQRRVNLLNHI
ncbi:Protein of unknown function [Cotesia congregata]|uniref:Uncharacterized protein n=1 Tax=Cotesia congregata TaxID=51543 RepID=A0A8J2HG30_COTCN|nr:Protein of unknown function [Cotesia congregata]